MSLASPTAAQTVAPTAPQAPVPTAALEPTFVAQAASQTKERTDFARWLTSVAVPLLVTAVGFFISLYVVQQIQAQNLSAVNKKIEEFQGAKEQRIGQVTELQVEVRDLHRAVDDLKVDVREGRQDIKTLLQRGR